MSGPVGWGGLGRPGTPGITRDTAGQRVHPTRSPHTLPWRLMEEGTGYVVRGVDNQSNETKHVTVFTPAERD